MNKIPFSGIIVLEGETDRAFLSSFIDAEFVITEGFVIPRETISYLKSFKETRQILAFADPDEAGETISKRIKEQIPSAIEIRLPKPTVKDSKKHGVAESDKEAVLEALKPYLDGKNHDKGALEFSDLMDLGLTGPGSAAKRERLMAKLSLGKGNAKRLLERANAVKLTKEDLRRALDE